MPIHSRPTLGESISMAAEAAHGSCLDLPPVRKLFAIRELPLYSRTGGEPGASGGKTDTAHRSTDFQGRDTCSHVVESPLRYLINGPEWFAQLGRWRSSVRRWMLWELAARWYESVNFKKSKK